MKKSLFYILALAVLAFPLFALAQSETFVFPGNVWQMALADGKLYIQTDADYPDSVVYLYSPENSSVPQLACEGLEAEIDSLVVLNSNLYVLKQGQASMKMIQSNNADKKKDSIVLLPEQFLNGKNEVYPFLLSINEGDTLTFMVTHGEEIHLCRLETISGEFKSVNMEENLYALQPYLNECSLLFRTNRVDGRKEIFEFNWDTLAQTQKGSLPADATGIAYNEDQDDILYIAGGCLWRYRWDGSSEQIMDGLPRGTDQRGFVLGDKHYVALQRDLQETLIMIDLTKVEEGSKGDSK